MDKMHVSLIKNCEGDPYIQLGNQVLRLESEEFDEEYRQKVEDKCRERPDIVKESAAELRKLIESDAELSFPVEDKAQLLKFLRPCKFYPDSSYRMIRRYYKFKTKYPKYCIVTAPEDLRNVLEQNIFILLPNRGPDDTRMLLMKMSNWNPKTCTLVEMYKAVSIALEAAMQEPKTQIAGVHVILDMEGLSAYQVYQFGPKFAKMILEWIQECIPLKLNGIHILNQPKIFNILFAIFKPFMGEKLKKRIHFHGTNTESLFKIIGPEYIPVHYGGNLDYPEMPGGLFCDLLCCYSDEIEKNNKIGYLDQGKTKS